MITACIGSKPRFPLDKFLPKQAAHNDRHFKGTKPTAHMSETTREMFEKLYVKNVTRIARRIQKQIHKKKNRQFNKLQGKQIQGD